MTKTLQSLLISAVLAFPTFAQSEATAAPNQWLYDAIYPKLQTGQQVAELVNKAGFTPASESFVARLPSVEMKVKFWISSDGDNLVLFLDLGALANEQANHSDQLALQIKETEPPQMKFNSVLYEHRLSQDSVGLAMLVLIPNHGITPEEFKQAVSELAERADASERVWRFWIKR